MIYRSLMYSKKKTLLSRLSLGAVSFVILVSIVLLAVNFAQIFPARAAGASLYLTPSSGSYVVSDQINVVVKAFTDSQAVNASEGIIKFDKNLLEVTSVSKSGSIFTMWTTEPSYSNVGGTITYGGGVPSPGFSSPSAGKVLTITFRAKAAGQAQLRFTSGALLASDGKGSNILETLGSANFTVTPKTEQAPADIRTASAGQIVNIETKLPSTASADEYLKPVVSSITNPDQNAWVKSNHVEFKWDLPTNVVGVSYAFNQKPDYKLEDKDLGLVTYKSYNNVTDGAWYFHVKLYDGKTWGVTEHYRVLVDTVRPKNFAVNVEQLDPGNWPVLYFKSSDDTSGVANYEIFVNSLEEEEYDVKDDASKDKLSIELAQLNFGDHTALVKVIDKAGNETASTIHFRIEPIQTPIVKDYSKEITPSEKFYISGTGIENTQVNLYIQNENGRVINKSMRTDAGGNWMLINSETLPNGRYVAWVEAENQNGLKSKPSSKISFMVTPPVFAVLGTFVINYFSVMASLLFVILLIIVMVYYLAQFIRKKLKKETIEVEIVLRENMNGLRQILAEEMDKLAKLKRSKAVIKEDTKLKETFSKYIEATEKKIMREIKDVENILH
jgi:positive regulator of sigma E activity